MYVGEAMNSSEKMVQVRRVSTRTLGGTCYCHLYIDKEHLVGLIVEAEFSKLTLHYKNGSSLFIGGQSNILLGILQMKLVFQRPPLSRYTPGWGMFVVCNNIIDPQIKLGGPGVVVAIDESVFSHKAKVRIHKDNNVHNLRHIIGSSRSTSTSTSLDVWLMWYQPRSRSWLHGDSTQNSCPLFNHTPILEPLYGQIAGQLTNILPASLLSMITALWITQLSLLAPLVCTLNTWNRVNVRLKRMRDCHRSQLPSYHLHVEGEAWKENWWYSCQHF